MGGLCLHMSYQHIRLQPNPQRLVVEFSLINDPESDATFFYYPSPTSSMVVSLDYDLVGWQQLLTDLVRVRLIYLKLVGNPCSLKYFTHSKCRWCLLNLLFVNKKVVNSLNNSKNLSCIMLPTFFLWKKMVIHLAPHPRYDPQPNANPSRDTQTTHPHTRVERGAGRGGFRGREESNQPTMLLHTTSKQKEYLWNESVKQCGLWYWIHSWF